MQELVTLVRLEMKKNNFKHTIFLGIVASSILLLYLLISAFLIKSGDITLENFFNEVLSSNKIVFTLFVALLINKLFCEEISSKSISILFTYPISRMKLLLTKVILIVVTAIPIMFCSMLFHFIILSLLNGMFHFVAGNFSGSLFVSYFFASLIHSILATLTAFIPIYIDVKFASTQRTITSAVVMAVFLYGMMRGSFFGWPLILSVATAGAGIYLTKKSLESICDRDIM